jgi:hypothetical protein
MVINELPPRGRYGIDLNHIEKGQVITTGQLEAITGHTPNSDEYRFAVMDIATWINRVTVVTAKACGDGSIRILTDVEAVDHNHEEHRNALRRAVRRYRKSQQVDVANLTRVERDKYDRCLLMQSRHATGIMQTEKQLRIEIRAEHPRRQLNSAQEDC